MTNPHDRAPLPWRADGATVYDADGAFVLDCWWEDAARIVAAVNGHAELEAENARLRGALGEAGDALDNYADHSATCERGMASNTQHECTCGLSSALATVRAALEQEARDVE